MFRCRSPGMNAKRLYEGVIVLTALYEPKTLSMGVAGRKR